jgi:hypothetical protein
MTSILRVYGYSLSLPYQPTALQLANELMIMSV